MSMSKMDWLVERCIDLLEEKKIDPTHYYAALAGREAMDLLAELHYGYERKDMYEAVDKLLEEFYK